MATARASVFGERPHYDFDLSIVPDYGFNEETGMASGIGLSEDGVQFRGVPITLTSPTLATLFMQNDYGKSRALIHLNQTDIPVLTELHGKVEAQFKQQFPDGELRPLLGADGELSIGFPKRPAYVTIHHESSSGLIEQLDLDATNNLLRGVQPKSIKGLLNVWMLKKEGVVKAGYYVTAKDFII